MRVHFIARHGMYNICMYMYIYIYIYIYNVYIYNGVIYIHVPSSNEYCSGQLLTESRYF